MMSEVGKALYKVSPMDLSTQDFILDSSNKGHRVSPQGAALMRIDLQQSLNGCPSKICFNADAKYYTPTFVDSSDQPVVQPNDQFLREIFERKIVESTCHRAKIYQPKPSSDYCFICKESFSDYLKHITHPVHTKKLEASNCEADISDLCKMAKKRASKSGEHGKQAEGSGRKRRKMEDSNMSIPQLQQNSKEGKGNLLFQSNTLLIMSTQ